MNDMIKVLKAADAAARWHIGQRREATKDPYINQPLEVAALVAEATEGRDPNLIIAALLHEVIEDCGISHGDIKARFGAEVADLVAEVSDDKTLTRAERKRFEIEHAHAKSDRAKVLKLADKTSNLRSLVTCTPADRTTLRQVEYVKQARRAAEGNRGTNAFLEGALDQAARAAEDVWLLQSGSTEDLKSPCCS
jgi:GTP diphosphokinase / guanosine-3',5'-bis(diphosphate) 3'-diphosphatase